MEKTGCLSSDMRLDIGEGVESFEGHNDVGGTGDGLDS